ncbi:hypothetical protein C8A05DRAFT_32030 [Staphylotrichum tortipilum]|uniref:Protein kinase domain-containing protein n=1 Tax=Staphylotrichum tortipilum TaxID=2831512 RepID=A0AAN6MPL3_9PEZI|nr:hypothetical protein C8A05DRAFT_32030 [Staphylotrichum longicolle]
MSSHVRSPARVRYAHIYQDFKGGCLYVRGLSSGHALVAQLVRRCSDGVVCVRKSLRRRCRVHGLERAGYEFAREMRVVARLQAVACVTGKTLRVPRLLSSTLTGDNGRGVSYWELCNGGTLFSFLMRCKAKRVALPVALALNFLRQVLETLEFLHTALATPVFHGDLHSFNLVLHFAPGRFVPELKLLDFGRARSLAATVLADDDLDDKALLASSDIVYDPTRWDTTAVLTWLRRDLLPRVMLNRTDLADLQEFRIAAFLAAHTDKDKHAEPLRHAYHLLERLEHQLSSDFFAAQARAAAMNPAAAVCMPPLPSLQPIINFLRRARYSHALGCRDKAHHGFWTAVVEPTHARAARYEGLEPLVCMTPKGLVEILHDAGMRGPWDVAMVDAGDCKMPVVGVLDGRERKVGRGLGRGWDEDEEEGEEEDREYGELW